MKFLCTLIFLTSVLAGLVAQDSGGARFGYPNVEERQIIGTRWKYAYTTHLESNTTIHQAEKSYQYFLHFKYDYSYEQSLNGELTRSLWSLKGSTLNYSFRNIDHFEIAEINNKVMILEFVQPNSLGTYQYHFNAVEAKDAPFVRPPGELPEVVIEAKAIDKKNAEGRRFGGGSGASQQKKNKEPVRIAIELVGGGYYGGIDPVVKDFIEIKPDGRLIQELQTINQPLRVIKKNIPRADLELFAEYIKANHFFESQRLYDCNSPACEKRKTLKPSPIPLRLMVAYGDQKKVITISIWGQDNYHLKYVDYPPALDKIIDAIQKLAHRIEDGSASARANNRKKP